MIIVTGTKLPPVKIDAQSQKEDTHSLVIKVIKENLKFDLDPHDINTCHRLGPVSRAQADSSKRNIVVKLCRRDKKNEIIADA